MKSNCQTHLFIVKYEIDLFTINYNINKILNGFFNTDYYTYKCYSKSKKSPNASPIPSKGPSSLELLPPP